MVHTMTLAQWMQIWAWITQWQHQNNTTDLPNYVTVTTLNIGIDRIEKNTYLDMLKRVESFQKTHQGKMPEIIGIESAATGTEPKPLNGSIKTRLETGLGTFNNFTAFWEKIKGRGYQKYYESAYPTATSITRLINRQGLNCVDSMKVCHALGIEMGYEVRYVHVQCKQGGHIRGQIRGHEFHEWTRIDPAAAISTNSQYPIGQVWCDYPNAHITTNNWGN